MENLELKAHYPDLQEAHHRAIQLGAIRQWCVSQTDTYFLLSDGKMKLRQVQGLSAELITYQRPQHQDAKRSAYQIYRTSEPQALIKTLSMLFPIDIIVQKTRTLYLWNTVRIHLDSVHDLGNFIEFEAVIGAPAHYEQAQTCLQELQHAFAIPGSALCASGYYELMQLRLLKP